MFTGIITDIGEVINLDETPNARNFKIRTSWNVSGIDIGASISHSGVCLTVTEKGEGWYAVTAAPETLLKTTAGHWQIGTKLNLEQSLKLGSELGGHFVFGHVDGLTEVVCVMPEGESARMDIRIPDGLQSFIAPKGSVALDGVSLTVNDVKDNIFGICLIPHTLAHTSFGDCQKGDKLNLEIDMLARYVRRMLGENMQEVA